MYYVYNVCLYIYIDFINNHKHINQNMCTPSSQTLCELHPIMIIVDEFRHRRVGAMCHPRGDHVATHVDGEGKKAQAQVQIRLEVDEERVLLHCHIKGRHILAI